MADVTVSDAPDRGGKAPPGKAPGQTARDLLVAIRREDWAAARTAEEALAGYDDAALAPIRRNRARGTAFWINCYNAGAQLLLERASHLYESRLREVRFFSAPALCVAGTHLSLDTIEHGILRGGRSKYGLGYLPRVFRSSFELRHSLSHLDPRIHFALNCGAVVCPAIRAYRGGDIDEQLDRATRAYLNDVSYDADDDVATLPALFRWYRGDFGGRAGIIELLGTHDVVPADATPTLSMRAWDWEKAPGAFATE